MSRKLPGGMWNGARWPMGPAHPARLRGRPAVVQLWTDDACRRFHHTGAGDPQDPRPRRPALRSTKTLRPCAAAVRRFRAQPVSRLRTAVRRPEAKTRKDSGHRRDARGVPGMRGSRFLRGKYAGAGRKRERASRTGGGFSTRGVPTKSSVS